MLVPWTEQKSTQRVFFLQQLKPTLPLNLMAWSCSASLLSLPPARGVSLLCYTACQFCNGSSLPLSCAQPNKASRCWAQPPLAPSSWILQFRVAHQCRGLAPWWSCSALVDGDHICSSDWAQKKVSFTPLDFNQTCSWKCLMAVFKIFLHNPYRQEVICVNANEI